MSIEVRNLQKRFGATVVCDRLCLTIASGELVALLTLALKSFLEARHGAELARSHGH